MVNKAEYLTNLGWKEVPGDNGGTCWKAPVQLKSLYFSLDEAYELEANGDGPHAYAGTRTVEDAVRDFYIHKSDGIVRGVYPNF